MSGASWNLSALGWWIAAFVLVLSHESGCFYHQANVVEPLHESVIVTSVGWDSLLSRWQSGQTWGTWPTWCVATAFASLLAWLASRIAVEFHSWLAGIMLIGLSLSVNTDQLIPSLLIMFTAQFLAYKRLDFRQFRTLGSAIFLCCAAILTTIEFGLVVLAVSVAVAADNYHDFLMRRWRPAAASIVMVVCIAAVPVVCRWHPPFQHALLRPINCAWYAIDHRVMPSLESTLFQPGDWIGVGCLLVLIVRTAGPRRGEFSTATPPLALFFGTVALVSSVNLWLSLVGVASLLSAGTSARRPHSAGSVRVALAPVACIMIASAHMLGTKLHSDGDLAASAVADRIVDHETWNVEGPVLLTNLNQSDDWKRPTHPGATSLLLDDRWDVSREQLVNYTAVCNDVLDGRQHSYRRSNGSWGGYAQYFVKWNPTLIVIDSVQLQAIRQFSVDPAWNILSIDARRTIFGNAATSQTRLRAKNAADLFYFLEWPNPRRRVTADGILQLGTAADARHVAAVFNAIRLPYAALRVLPQDDHHDTDFVRAWSYTELAQRSLRQTGRWSLIDQFRAVRQLKQLTDSHRLTPARGRLVQKRLASLANETTRAQSVPDPDTRGSENRPSDTEMKIRRNLASANSGAVARLMPDLPQPSVRAYYAAVESLRTRSIDEVSTLLLKTAENPALPVRLREEAFFYLGGLALERRRPDEASHYLNKSLQARATSHLTALRSLYMLQLGQ